MDQTGDGARVSFAVCAPSAVDAAMATLDDLAVLGVRVRGLVGAHAAPAEASAHPRR